ncbi:MAG: hypothetical protein DWQ29_20955, partial [Planctomycetota bacterium]
GCEQLTGWSAGDVIGKTCDFATVSDPEDDASVTGRICPPERVFSGEPFHVKRRMLHRDGSASLKLLHFFPIAESDGDPPRILGVITDAANLPQDDLPLHAKDGDLHAELSALQAELRGRYGTDTIIGAAASVERVRRQIEAAARTEVCVLIEGEAGSGREHVARSIHAASDQRLRAFIPVDCELLPAFELKRLIRRLIDEEGHEGGPPNFQPGTLLLKQPGALPRELQQTLADFYASGDSRRRRLRLIAAATEVPPREEMIDEYYFLLTEMTIELPPLRNREADIDVLAQFFLEQTNRHAERQANGFSPDVLAEFRRYNWPGNVAELKAVVEEARAACTTAQIGLHDLPFRFRTGIEAQGVGPSLVPEPIDLEAVLSEVEADHIRWALRIAKDNKAHAARLLGLTRPRLYRRMEALGIAD